MSEDALTIQMGGHLRAFERMASESKKTAVELWRKEAKIIFGGSGSMPGVAGITPPYGAGRLQSAAQAGAHGRAKVAADIYSLYGTPGDAFEAIQEASPGDAQAFWYLHKHGDNAGASQLLREATGSILHPFDDGVHHRRNFRRRRRGGGSRRFKFFVTDPKNLKAYVQLEQEQVWWLASGWREPLEALEASLPAGVTKHAAPGHLSVVIDDSGIEITAGNEVSYGGAIKDMTRRINAVLDYRTKRLDRMWEFYLARLRKEAGVGRG